MTLTFTVLDCQQLLFIDGLDIHWWPILSAVYDYILRMTDEASMSTLIQNWLRTELSTIYKWPWPIFSTQYRLIRC